MKNLHLTVMVFCHALLASLVFYFAAPLASASPLVAPLPEPAQSKHTSHDIQHRQPNQAPALVQPMGHEAELIPKQKIDAPVIVPMKSVASPASLGSSPASKLLEAKSNAPAKEPIAKLEPKLKVEQPVEPDLLEERKDHQKVEEKKQPSKLANEALLEPKVAKPSGPVPVPKEQLAATAEQLHGIPQPAALVLAARPASAPAAAHKEQQIEQKSQLVSRSQIEELAKQSVVKKEQPQVKLQSPLAIEPLVEYPSKEDKLDMSRASEKKQSDELSELNGKIAIEQAHQPAAVKSAPPVNGGLGPLHLLATTLCSYQPDRPVVDDMVNQLYARRAIVRKSLFDFMSLKFTNLEKLSSRLGVGLQVVPVKSVPDPLSSTKPSHGWPMVGKCTAYDLKLMGEAAWCDESDQDSAKQPQAKQQSPASPLELGAEKQIDKVEAKQKSARSIETIEAFSPEQASVISKILHVGDIKDAPVVESTFYNLNLTQHQLATLEAQATSTQECRRNALRYSKALFQHLAEDQQSISDSWPKLYAQISEDDCARKRMIDIINALSSFRTDTTSIRRDNIEFAFAMDDLRTKVLDNEVNVPLTFDRHFIEVEQFLQQSVRLMLDSVQPKRAKLTTMRYRNLMYGATNLDDQQQCIDLHQRLLAKNYPKDCNPTQFGQLPDVLRMTANSLELWSIERELSLHLAKIADYPNITPVGQQKVKEDVNECITNLVAS